MIEINLTPSNLRKNENQGMGALALIALPKEVLLGVGSLFIIALFSVHIVLIVFWSIRLSELTASNTQWQKMIPDKNNMDSINQEIKDLREKLNAVADITSKKAISWSQKFNILSDVMPKGVWIRKINWNNNVLNIEGSAVSKLHDEITIIGNFISNLKREENFAKDFLSIDLGSVNRSKKGAIEVVDFIITAKMK